MIIIGILIGVNFFFYGAYQGELNFEIERYQKQQAVALEISDLFISDRLKTTYEGLQLVKNSNEMEAYLNNGQDDYLKKQVGQMFYRYASASSGLTQIRLIDTKGQEILRYNRKGDLVTRVNETELQDKSDRYYFIRTMQLSPGEMYISDFDLNVENGIVVEPYEPTLRFSMKLYDNHNELKGILIFNFDGLQFLSIIEKYERMNLQDLDIGIMDLNNYWSLNHAENNDLNSVVFSMKTSEGDEIWQKIHADIERRGQYKKSGYYHLGTEYYYYKQIANHESLGYVFEGQAYSWYFVSKFDINKLIIEEQPFLKNYRLYLLLLNLLTIILASVVLILHKQRENQKFMLLSSAYISNNSHDGIVILDAKKRIVYFNTVFQDIYGYSNGELQHKKISDLFDGHIEFSGEDVFDETLWDGNIWNKTKYGNLVLKHLLIKKVIDKQKKLMYYIGIYSNPSSVDRVEEEDDSYTTRYLSQNDLSLIGQTLDYNMRDEKRYMVVAIQFLEGTRNLLESNQSIQGKFLKIGQSEVLLETDYRIIAVPKPDLFLLATPISEQTFLAYESSEIKGSDSALVVETMSEIDRMFKKTQVALNLSANVFKYHSGVAVTLDASTTGKGMVANALVALEALTKLKHSNYLLYDTFFYEYIREENYIRSELINAFHHDEFRVYYQPQINLFTNQVIGVEALVRWENQKFGNINPSRFVPILEEMDDIRLLGKTVLSKVLEDIKRIPKDELSYRVSINLSSREFTNNLLMRELIEIVEQEQYKNHTFCFEITETTLVKNLDQANATIKLLRDAGIDIAIDDFGTGYSSLGYLKNLFADELKIDRMFIMDYPDKDDGKILKAIIRMGKEMNISLVIEGVETKAQYELVKELDCDHYQGYYAAKPMPFDVFLAWQEERSK
jgi:PAS domain S-box-containing protein